MSGMEGRLGNRWLRSNLLRSATMVYQTRMSTFEVRPTPNPHSLKFAATGKPFRDAGLGAYASAAEAADDPLASALFAIDGVADVLILPAFTTVTKRPDADWNALLPRVEAVIERHFER
jgi:hypothetical protein